MEIDGGKGLAVVSADLHIHTCLSPCATLDMTPRKIVRAALRRGLGLIAVTDHNSAENVPAMIAASRATGLCVIPGMEVTSSEEAHILGLFPDVEAALSMQALVYQHLQPGENDERLFGMQVVTNEREEVEAVNTRLLIAATRLDIARVVRAIHERRGLAVAAHVNRQSFSVLSQLGFIPEGLDFDAIEVSRHMTMGEALSRFRRYRRFPFVTGSDAHDLEEIGASATRLLVRRPDFDELGLALASGQGRRVLAEENSRTDGRPCSSRPGSG